jgi:hypothetical protein
VWSTINGFVNGYAWKMVYKKAVIIYWIRTNAIAGLSLIFRIFSLLQVRESIPRGTLNMWTDFYGHLMAGN